MKLRSKKGAAFVEAAVVFPLVILSIAGLLTLNIHLYSDVRCQCLSHRESRATGESLALHEADMLRKAALLQDFVGRNQYENPEP